MFSYLTQPHYPTAAIGIEKDNISAIALDRQGRGQYSVRQAATIEVPNNLINPSFLERNIASQDEFRVILEEAVTTAGLLNQKRWSVSLPSASARTAIITLESEPASRQEAQEVIEWKSEQSFGAPAGELRITRQKIDPDRQGRTRYFSTAVRLAVIDEYETVFEQLGWKAGDVQLYEVNEAFAAVTMAAMRDVGFEHARTNVNGGACALGHPVGATGARIVATLVHALRARGGGRGIASLCIGVCEATAIAVEVPA